ncbi:unnamed protein product, partial [Sphagnum troendelagicum]
MVRSVKLNNGSSLPILGMGTVALSESQQQVKDALLTAIQVGYRHFDTAMLYGTEAALGDALVEAFSTGLVKREEIFVTTKLWITDNHPAAVLPALQTSLRKLKLDYVDLYLIHWPIAAKDGIMTLPTKDQILPHVDLKGVWAELEHFVEKGLIKSIGVSNFSSKKLESLLSYAKILPAVNQVEMHPCWQQKQLREYCKNKGIQITAYSPLTSPAPGAEVYFNQRISVLKDPIILAIAEQHAKSPAQIALRWIIETGCIPVPKSFNKSHMSENLEIFDWELTDEDRQKISTIPQARGSCAEFMVNEATGPYRTLQELWDDEGDSV